MPSFFLSILVCHFFSFFLSSILISLFASLLIVHHTLPLFPQSSYIFLPSFLPSFLSISILPVCFPSFPSFQLIFPSLLHHHTLSFLFFSSIPSFLLSSFLPSPFPFHLIDFIFQSSLLALLFIYCLLANFTRNDFVLYFLLLSFLI